MAKKSGGISRVKRNRVKTAKSRSVSSARWLDRHINDPFVQQARQDGFRSRSAYKLAELDDKFGFLKPSLAIIDLGAAPGGWCQIAADRAKGSIIVGVDLLPVKPITGVETIEGDFQDETVQRTIIETLGGKADVILSDMAPNTTGHQNTDHLRIVALFEDALDFAVHHLKPGGTFAAKVFQGGTEHELLKEMKRQFTSVKHAKPKSSRAESAEIYVVATGFREL